MRTLRRGRGRSRPSSPPDPQNILRHAAVIAIRPTPTAPTLLVRQVE